MFVIAKKCRTLKSQKAKLHYVPYKTSKLKVFFDGGLKLNSIAKLLLEVYAWPNLKIFHLHIPHLSIVKICLPRPKISS